MIVTVAEVKQNLRLETAEDDAMIAQLIETGQRLVMDILRTDEAEDLTSVSAAKVAILYAASYLYENRAEASHSRLIMNLRALLFAERRDAF